MLHVGTLLSMCYMWVLYYPCVTCSYSIVHVLHVGTLLSMFYMWVLYCPCVICGYSIVHVLHVGTLLSMCYMWVLYCPCVTCWYFIELQMLQKIYMLPSFGIASSWKFVGLKVVLTARKIPIEILQFTEVQVISCISTTRNN